MNKSVSSKATDGFIHLPIPNCTFWEILMCFTEACYRLVEIFIQKYNLHAKYKQELQAQSLNILFFMCSYIDL